MSLRPSSLKKIISFTFEFRIPNDASRSLLQSNTDGRGGSERNRSDRRRNSGINMWTRQGEMTAPNDVPTFGRRIEDCPYIVRPSAYALIRRGANELAVVRNAEGVFLPGGGLEAGESAAQAIQREAIEECGLILSIGTFKVTAIEIVYSSNENICFEKQSEFLESDIIGFCSPTQDGHELVWLSIAQAIETLSPESHRWAVERLTEETA